MDETQHNAGEGRTIAAVETTFDIIEALVENDGAKMTELTEILDYSKSAIYCHLRTLEKQKYVVREGNKYRPSLKFLDVGQRVTLDHVIYKVGREEIENLAKETGEDGWIMVEEYGQGIYVYREHGHQGVDDFPLGRPSGLHCTAAGKAILAHLSDDRVQAILNNHGLPAITENTITTQHELYEEIEEIRESGIALSLEEAAPGIRAVAAPVLASDDVVLGAISISGPSSRFTGDWFENELPDRLRETSNIIEINAMKELHQYTF